jgi:hypothetical protein
MSKQLYCHVIRAEFIQRTLGTRCAAGFLRNRDVPFEIALQTLVPNAKPRA